jgi:hypothetical protein
MADDNIFTRVNDFLHRKKEWYDLPTILAIPHLIRMRMSYARRIFMTRKNRRCLSVVLTTRCPPE